MSSERMNVFDKCIDQLLEAVTADMLHVDNMKTDIQKVTDIKVTRTKQKELERIRKDVIGEFKKRVEGQINDSLKSDLSLKECFDEFENKSQQKKNAWRINGDPQHDTFADRKKVYLEYIDKLTEAEKTLTKEYKDLLAQNM